ncbi:MAG: M48 family metalloprotease [Desulfatirhabdiaceae bacterium]|nr:M48 family metalloprotease [Desulfatirhabdiaceae bacterium]
MFANFIYLIIALLIYTTYYPPDQPNFQEMDAALLVLFLITVFAAFTRFQFRRIEKRIGRDSFIQLDHRFSSALTRHAILAIGFFACSIYGLNLTALTGKLPFVSSFPTIEALICLSLFLLYMIIVWIFAWFPYEKLYQNKISLRSYVSSQISFSIPVVIPWVLISGISDILQALPFDLPKKLLATSTGQILFFLFFLVAVALTGPAMIQKFWRCRPLESGPVRQRIEALSRRAGFSFANIVYWPVLGGRMITAGVMGLIRPFRYLLVTEALLEFLSPEEVDAVVAHEIGHVKKKHLQFYLLFLTGYMFLSYALFDVILIAILYIPQLYPLMEQFQGRQTTAMSAFFSLGAILSFLIYFRYIFGYFMRNFERQADAFVFTLFNSSIPLITTLQKIAMTSGQPANKPNWHHYSILERIYFLRKCETDRSWISRHDRKLRRGIAVYLAGILMVGALGYTLNWGDTGKKLNAHLFEQVLLREIEKNPDNPVAYNVLGDTYVLRENFEMAQQAYNKAILLQPDNFSALNNLAWILATSEDEAFRNPRRAVLLAARAAELKPSSQILDTFAECLYRNGQPEEAIYIGEKALLTATGDRSYFERQLKKYRQALKGP